MKKLLLILLCLPFIGCFSSISKQEYYDVLSDYNKVSSENAELKQEIDELKASLEFKEIELDFCRNQIDGDGFILDYSGYSGNVRILGYKNAVEYLENCCWNH